MKKISYLIFGLALVACQDDWNDHYGQTADTQYGNASLYEVIGAQSELSDFCQVLDSVRVFANNRITSIHYSEMLNEGQFFTVWAPKNGSFNKDSLLRLCQTSEGDSLVELHFLKNHIARYTHSVNGKEEDVRMLNAKQLTLGAGTFGNMRVATSNIATSNGVLHILDNPVSYYYNIYEALVSLPEYQHLGSFLRSYQIDEFDETQSLAMGIVDGKTVYVDSVFYAKNELLDKYGYINSEDSTYWMIVPSQTLWDSLYAEAETYYNYGSLNKADSIHNYWSHYALMQDLVFNPNPDVQKSILDSICSTTWNKRDAGKYHVYYNAFNAGGLFTQFSDSMVCANGSIYEVSSWPFVKEKSYFIPIKTEAEGRYYEAAETATKTLGIDMRRASADSISGGYIVLTPQTGTDAYYITYEIPDVLSGSYDVKVVMLPKSVYYSNIDPNTVEGKRLIRPVKFLAEITFAGADGQEYKVDSRHRYSFDESTPGYYTQQANSATDYPFLFDCNLNPNAAATRAFTNNPFLVDTIQLCTMTFPTCNYAQNKVTTRLKITNNIGSKETNTYNNSMFIDCIIFQPHTESGSNN
ncbi:MAG: fasciclin domain-containing protein [Bacteroidales bacterium]|nr:fasciclin domain-containing protein [Bacteroidales bacterium]